MIESLAHLYSKSILITPQHKYQRVKKSLTNQELNLGTSAYLFFNTYTLSHPENDRDVTDVMVVLGVRQSICYLPIILLTLGLLCLILLRNNFLSSELSLVFNLRSHCVMCSVISRSARSWR